MPMDFLKRIEDASFPLAVHEKADIHSVAVLVAAELVEATLPPPGDAAAGQAAVIQRITPLGRAELRRIGGKLA